MTSSKSPSVLMFGWEFPPFNSGGLGTACEGMTKALSASGVDLTFVLPMRVPISVPWCRFAFANDLTNSLSEVQIKSLFAGYQSHADVVSVKGKYGLPVKISGNLVERVRQYALGAPTIASNYDHSVIHAHDWLTYPAGIAAQEISGKPLVAHIHATEFDRSGDSVNKQIFDIEMEGFKRADTVVAVSGRTRNTVIKKYGIDPKKVEVVYNGIEFSNSVAGIEHNLEKLKREGNSIVLFVGRITLQKGPDYFVDMAKKVLEFEPKTFFVVSGSGDMEGEMIRRVAGQGIANHFIFCGFLRGDELARVYKAADMFVMPSVSEPFGLVPLEAMIAEVPVLVSYESGVSEILTNALKSHFWDIDDMADKVVSVLRHYKLKNHLLVSGREEVKGIHWKKAADSLISVYKNLVPHFEPVLIKS
jgi:glycosyltransferase involved in cell wall biosynthesis